MRRAARLYELMSLRIKVGAEVKGIVQSVPNQVKGHLTWNSYNLSPHKAFCLHFACTYIDFMIFLMS